MLPDDGRPPTPLARMASWDEWQSPGKHKKWASSGWELGALLGSGTFSRVYAGKNTKTHETGAIKVICKDDDENPPDVIAAEIEVLELVADRLRSCKGVIKLKNVYEDVFNVYIVTDLCHGGTLSDKQASVPGRHLEERLTKLIARELLATLKDFHAARIIHCDLKPDNIVFSAKDEFGSLKVADFGLSLSEHSDPDQPLMGTKNYVAPEVLRQQNYTSAVDIWGLGVVVYELLCGRVPFASDEKTKQNTLRFYDEIWESVSADAKDFVRSCLNKDPKQRPAASHLLKHKWLADAPREAASPVSVLDIGTVAEDESEAEQSPASTSVPGAKAGLRLPIDDRPEILLSPATSRISLQSTLASPRWKAAHGAFGPTVRTLFSDSDDDDTRSPLGKGLRGSGRPAAAGDPPQVATSTRGRSGTAVESPANASSSEKPQRTAVASGDEGGPSRTRGGAESSSSDEEDDDSHRYRDIHAGYWGHHSRIKAAVNSDAAAPKGLGLAGRSRHRGMSRKVTLVLMGRGYV